MTSDTLSDPDNTKHSSSFQPHRYTLAPNKLDPKIFHKEKKMNLVPVDKLQKCWAVPYTAGASSSSFPAGLFGARRPSPGGPRSAGLRRRGPSTAQPFPWIAMHNRKKWRPFNNRHGNIEDPIPVDNPYAPVYVGLFHLCFGLPWFIMIDRFSLPDLSCRTMTASGLRGTDEMSLGWPTNCRIIKFDRRITRTSSLVDSNSNKFRGFHNKQGRFQKKKSFLT